MTDRPKLTARQERILDAIRSAVRERGYPPSLRELTATVGISSSSTAAEQLRILQARGYIKVTPNTPRGIMLLDPVPPSMEQAGLLLPMAREARLHPRVYVCPGCGAENMHSTVGLDRLAQVYDVCTCRAPGFTFDHLIEQLWHRACLTGQADRVLALCDRWDKISKGETATTRQVREALASTTQQLRAAVAGEET